MTDLRPLYKRILLKLSGEVLSGDQGQMIDPTILSRIATEIASIAKLGVQVGLVIGGGNLFRGETLAAAGVDRITADHVGMLATAMNALVIQDALERCDVDVRVLSAIPMQGLMDCYDRRRAMGHLRKGRIILFAGGTGNPLVTTDSAASLRAIEIGAEILLKGTIVDGVYSADPKQTKNAVLHTRLSYQEAIARELKVMDQGAFRQCQDHKIKIRVFNIKKPQALLHVVSGQEEGTLVE